MQIKHIWADKKFVNYLDEEKTDLKSKNINKIWNEFNSYGRNFLVDSLINAKQSDILLDIGCGEGDRIKKFDQKCKVIGIDISFKMCKKAKENVINGDIIVANLETLPFKDNSLHKISAIYSIIYSFSKQNVFYEISRVLKNRGELILYEPNKCSFLTLIRYLQNIRFHFLKNKNPKVIHHRIVTRQSLNYFDLKKIGAQNDLKIDDWYGHFFIQILFNKKSTIPIRLLKKLNYNNWGKIRILNLFSDFLIIKFIKNIPFQKN